MKKWFMIGLLSLILGVTACSPSSKEAKPEKESVEVVKKEEEPETKVEKEVTKEEEDRKSVV